MRWVMPWHYTNEHDFELDPQNLFVDMSRVSKGL